MLISPSLTAYACDGPGVHVPASSAVDGRLRAARAITNLVWNVMVQLLMRIDERRLVRVLRPLHVTHHVLERRDAIEVAQGLGALPVGAVARLVGVPLARAQLHDERLGQ